MSAYGSAARRRQVSTAAGQHQQAAEPGQTTEAYVTASYTLANRRTARPAALLEAVRRLDLSTDPQVRSELMAWITQAYTDRRGGVLIGLFSRCYLGPPYVDHRLTMAGHILEHYTRADVVPAPFDQARGLARSHAYEYIEVYDDGQVVPIRADGSPA